MAYAQTQISRLTTAGPSKEGRVLKWTNQQSWQGQVDMTGW
jgi:hypothetical protein